METAEYPKIETFGTCTVKVPTEGELVASVIRALPRVTAEIAKINQQKVASSAQMRKSRKKYN